MRAANLVRANRCYAEGVFFGVGSDTGIYADCLNPKEFYCFPLCFQLGYNP